VQAASLYFFPFYVSVLLVTVIFSTTTLLIGKLTDVFDDLISYAGPAAHAWEYLASLLPGYLHFTLPLSFFFTGMFFATRFRQSNEFIALWAAGQSLIRVLSPIWLCLVGLASLSFLHAEYVLPAANTKVNALYAIIRGAPVTALTHAPTNLHLAHGDESLFVSEVNPGEKQATGVLYTVRQKNATQHWSCGAVRLNTFAAIGHGCRVFKVRRDGKTEVSDDQTANLSNPIMLSALHHQVVPADHATMSQMFAERTFSKLRGLQPSAIETEIWYRIFFPFGILSSGFLGILLGARFAKAGFAPIFIATFVFGVLSYGMTNALRSLGNAALLPSALAAGLPIFAVTATAFVLYRRQAI